MKNKKKKLNLDCMMINWSDNLFADRKIDICPLTGEDRGFIIFIDRKFSLWFYQKGDHFELDGNEFGPYDPGEVTVFDGLKKH